MHIAVLVKQIPKFEEMELGPDGRLRRDGIEPEMNPYCRRAVSKAVELAAEHAGSRVTVFTLGPPAADDTLREAIAWGLDRDVDIHGVHVTDAAFAGSDTLATAKALAAAITREGPFDLVLAGRNSVDADTGQVGPELAELLDLPFLTGVRHLAIEGTRVDARCEHDDGWLQAEVELPAVLSCAERLCEPTKVDPEGRAAVPADRIRRAHRRRPRPRAVGRRRVTHLGRAGEGDGREPGARHQARRTARRSGARRGAHPPRAGRAARRRPSSTPTAVPAARSGATGPAVAVVAEPDRAHATRELLGVAARLAAEIDGHVVAITVDEPHPAVLGSWGADRDRARRERQRRGGRRGRDRRLDRGRRHRGRSSRARPRGAARSRHASRPGSARASPATPSTSR